MNYDTIGGRVQGGVLLTFVRTVITAKELKKFLLAVAEKH
jgi:hypothetical protein